MITTVPVWPCFACITCCFAYKASKTFKAHTWTRGAPSFVFYPCPSPVPTVFALSRGGVLTDLVPLPLILPPSPSLVSLTRPTRSRRFRRKLLRKLMDDTIVAPSGGGELNNCGVGRRTGFFLRERETELGGGSLGLSSADVYGARSNSVPVASRRPSVRSLSPLCDCLFERRKTRRPPVGYGRGRRTDGTEGRRSSIN